MNVPADSQTSWFTESPKLLRRSLTEGSPNSNRRGLTVHTSRGQINTGRQTVADELKVRDFWSIRKLDFSIFTKSGEELRRRNGRETKTFPNLYFFIYGSLEWKSLTCFFKFYRHDFLQVIRIYLHLTRVHFLLVLKKI